MMNNIIELYCDGACKGNPGPGGWSCIAYLSKDKILDISFVGSEEETTNNRMELTGLLKALRLAQTIYKNKTCLIYCDSSYCINMYYNWIHSWACQNWVKSNNEVIKNYDLVKRIYEYTKIDFPNFQILKTKGHAGIVGNELADAAARGVIINDFSKFDKILKKNNIDVH